MSNNAILSLLGLALRGGRLIVGEEPVEGAVRAKDARVLLVASDAADNTRRRCRHFSEIGQCLCLWLPFTKFELGQALGRSSVAIVAVTDIGLAHAIVLRLAELDPKQYADAAAKLELKAQRAAERKAEHLAHEKNVRIGKVKPKKAAEVPAKKSGSSDRKAPASAEAAPRRTSSKSRPSKANRPKSKAKANPYAHSRPVKKGKGSFLSRKG